jgi:hypothetical protein
MIDAKITEKLNADYAFEMNISLPDAPIKYGEILADDNIYSDDDIHSGDEIDVQVLAKYELIEKGMIIKANDQLFRISEFRKEFNSYYIFARHIFYDLADNFLEDVRPTNQNGSGALNWILSNTLLPNNFVSLSDISTVTSAEYIRKNPVDAILGNNENSFMRRRQGRKRTGPGFDRPRRYPGCGGFVQGKQQPGRQGPG